MFTFHLFEYTTPPRVALYYLNTRLAIINMIKFHGQRTIL